MINLWIATIHYGVHVTDARIAWPLLMEWRGRAIVSADNRDNRLFLGSRPVYLFIRTTPGEI